MQCDLSDSEECPLSISRCKFEMACKPKIRTTHPWLVLECIRAGNIFRIVPYIPTVIWCRKNAQRIPEINTSTIKLTKNCKYQRRRAFTRRHRRENPTHPTRHVSHSVQISFDFPSTARTKGNGYGGTHSSVTTPHDPRNSPALSVEKRTSQPREQPNHDHHNHNELAGPP
jgi:hypothetical protein